MHCTYGAILRALFFFLFINSATGLAQNVPTPAPAQPVSFTNPILAGFYPDPSICRGGDTENVSHGNAAGVSGAGPGRAGADFYLVNSSFAYFPGLPVFHSADLVNWRQIGNAMDRPEQIDLAGAGVSRGLFAPALRYYQGLYYITCTLVDRGGNFVIT